jgi:RimJ/RimL family protein N-acetyltransferase
MCCCELVVCAKSCRSMLEADRCGWRRPTVKIETPRIRLRCWQGGDREAFAAMNADPEVMRDLGGPISREESDSKLDRFAAAFHRYGLGRLVVESPEGHFLGYASIMPSPPQHPLGSHFEIGWRLVRSAWGHGYATEAAEAALHDAVARAGLTEILSYTASDNIRSQAVMVRLGLRRCPSLDFTADYEKVGSWRDHPERSERSHCRMT